LAEVKIDVYEYFARRIAARKMGLLEDKEGAHLPANIWAQCLPEAISMVAAVELILEALIKPQVH
jgi:hypothetical protein